MISSKTVNLQHKNAVVSLLDHNAIWRYIKIPTFWRNMPSPPSALKIEAVRLSETLICTQIGVRMMYQPKRPNIDVFTAMRISNLSIKSDYEYGPYVFIAGVSFYIFLKSSAKTSCLESAKIDFSYSLIKMADTIVE
jgi:hypothetical protein